LQEVGYDAHFIARVQSLNLKREFPNDPEGRVLEDALCLVFLEFQLADLASKTSEEKVINALQKSWKKMSARAQELAEKIDYGPRERELIVKALKG